MVLIMTLFVGHIILGLDASIGIAIMRAGSMPSTFAVIATPWVAYAPTRSRIVNEG